MQAQEKMRGKARYVFAGSEHETSEEGTKICPRCGQVLFADMDVCYGCLYDFTRDHHGDQRAFLTKPGQSVSARLRAVPRIDDPLEDVEIDEIDELDDESEAIDDKEDADRTPRHRKQPSVDANDTLDLGTGGFMATTVSTPLSATAAPCLVVSTNEIQVRLPLGLETVSVGRDESNDVVLRNRSVSRRHVRVSYDGREVMVEDCGATNPAQLRGRPLEGSEPLRQGEVLDICGARLSLG